MTTAEIRRELIKVQLKLCELSDWVSRPNREKIHKSLSQITDVLYSLQEKLKIEKTIQKIEQEDTKLGKRKRLS